jgi:acyl-CoA synthetase (AMP-forming)/AMP-acid ligase II
MESRRPLAEAFHAACDLHGNRLAVSGEDVAWTYADLRDQVERLTQVYRSLGIGNGDRIVVSMSNSPEYIVAVAAAWASGAVHVGADVECPGPELLRIVGITGARLLICEPRASGEAIEAVLRRTHKDVRSTNLFAVRQIQAFEIAAPAPHASGTGDEAVLFISSGTTGVPKATVGFHRNLALRWTRLGEWLGFTADDTHLAHLPLSHGFGLMMAIAALFRGGRLVLMRRFSAELALQLIAVQRVSVFNGSPTHFKLILDRLRRSPTDVSSLRLSVGTAASFPPSLVEAMWRELSVDFVYMYGSSEGVGVATKDREDILLGSVGRPQPGSTRIVGPNHEDLPVGEIGEIAFSRKVYPVAYWSAGGAQSEWFFSGDRGRLDEQGRLYVFGRFKHQIDRGGLKIDPIEVERVLLACGGIADAAVLGVPDPVLGETVCACVVPESGAAITLEGVRDAVGRELASFKLPTSLVILDSIPRTTLGKVNLERLRSCCDAVLQP